MRIPDSTPIHLAPPPSEGNYYTNTDTITAYCGCVLPPLNTDIYFDVLSGAPPKDGEEEEDYIGSRRPAEVLVTIARLDRVNCPACRMFGEMHRRGGE